MYTKQGNIEDKLAVELTGEQANYFNDVLSSAIDNMIDNLTGTTFGSTEPSDVYVDGQNSSMLVIPTMHSITAVYGVDDDNDTSLVENTDYTTYPRGSSDKYALKRTNGTWDEGVENYRITGVPGYTDVPGEIVQIATELACNLLLANSNNYKSERVGDWSVTYAEQSEDLSSSSKAVLNRYKRLSRSI